MKRFIGTWRLISYEFRFDDGTITHPVGDRPVGLLIYDAAGNIAVQYSLAQRPMFAQGSAARGTVEEKAAAFDTFRAYFGTYEIDEVAQTVIHRVVQGTDPHYANTGQVRHFLFADERLILETPRREIDGNMAYGHLEWQRVTDA